MKSYSSVNDKVRKDKDANKHKAAKNYLSQYKDLINKCKQFIKKYPDSKYAVSLIYRITGILLTVDDFDELSAYMQNIEGDSKLQGLKPYALTALASKQIRTGNPKDAIGSYERLIKTYPSNSLVVEWLYSEGSVYKYLLKDEQKANDIFTQIIQSYPNSPTAQSAKNLLGIKTNKLLVKKQSPSDVMPKEFSADNYPNPFNPSTIITYTLPKDGFVTLKVYDMLGREVKTLVAKYQNQGKYDVTFNAGELASGIYIYVLRSGNFVSNKKLILMK